MASLKAPRVNGTRAADTLIGELLLENTIYGSYGDDLIIGGDLNDVLVGEADRDTLRGGLGNDGLWGGGANDQLYGEDGNDVLRGDGGNDLLDGGTGADTMVGGEGHDSYYVDDVADVVIERANQGTDTVYSAISYTLGANLERLELTGSGDLSGTGNGLDNRITGNAGNNTIDGGTGADTMIGGAGDDTYYADNAGDVVIELAGEGTDTLITRFNTVLSANIENVILTGAGLKVTGNDLDNVIIGTSGKNHLRGGNGNDKLDGAGGNDKLEGGEGRDHLIGGQGLDYLNGGAREDKLDGGNDRDRLYGGGGNDTIYGGDGNDAIYGDGGNDVIHGGTGNDVLGGGQLNGAGIKGIDTFVWDRADVVNANGSSAGFDTIVDFRAGDRLDLTDVFNGTHPTDLEAVIRVTNGANGTTISADAGGGTFYDIALLRGVHVSSVADFLNQYDIIV